MCVDYQSHGFAALENLSHGFNMKMGQKACIRSTEGRNP